MTHRMSLQGEAEGDIAARDVVRLGRLPRHGLLGAPDASDEAVVDRAMAETECSAFALRRLNERSGGERQRVLLARAREGAAVVTVLHDLTLALAADRVLVMHHGRICADGAPADATLRHTLMRVFDGAFSIERVLAAGQPRWVAVPTL